MKQKEEMKKSKGKWRIIRRIIIVSAAIMITAGIITACVIGGSYYFHKKQVEDVVSQVDERIDTIEEYSKKLQNNTQPQNKNSSESKEDSKPTKNEKGSYFEWNGTSDANILPYKIDTEKLKEDSIKYNESLKKTQSTKLVGEESYTYAALDLSKYGIYDNVYGYVSAPSIGMKLPIYLGVTDSNMAYGAAHFCYTSLPTGGESTNCVLAGHTGYVGRWLFDDIKNLSFGDDVEVKSYIGTLKYKVKKIKYVLPNESNDIYIEKGKDKLTLVTCTYSSDGTYMRCIVICER